MSAPSPEIERIDAARRLLLLGVPPRLVAYSLDLLPVIVARWARELDCPPPRKGPLLRTRTVAYVQSAEDARCLSSFCALYLAEPRSETNEDGRLAAARRLADALDRYQHLFVSTINCSMAWLAARELDAGGVLQLRACSDCSVQYVHDPETPSLRGCPFCKAGSPAVLRAPRKRVAGGRLAEKKLYTLP